MQKLDGAEWRLPNTTSTWPVQDGGCQTQPQHGQCRTGIAKHLNMANGMAKNMAKNMAKTGNTYETSQMQELDVASAKHNLNMAKIGNTEERVSRYISPEISTYIRDQQLTQKIARM